MAESQIQIQTSQTQTQNNQNININRLIKQLRKLIEYYSGIRTREIRITSDIIEIRLREREYKLLPEKVKEILDSYIMLLGFKYNELWKFKLSNVKEEIVKVFNNDVIKIEVHYIYYYYFEEKNRVWIEKIKIKKT